MPALTAPAPACLATIASAVDARMEELLEAETRRWTALDADLAQPLASLRALVVAGGKRLRPAFCHWAFLGAGGDPDDRAVVDAGAALELLHTFALIHDDVMDGSVRRRGLEAVHTAFARRHLGAGWRGEARRFGDGMAILVGDLAFVYADMLMEGAPAGAVSVFSELRVEVNIGQFLDLMGTATGRATPDQARRIGQLKSGRYTVERPLHLGAALTGPDAHDRLAGPLSAYGAPLGEAFQLRDDLLGAFGDAARTGKAVGDDLRDGKPTLLYALARERAVGPAAALLEHRFGCPDLDEADVHAIQEVFEATGARQEVEQAIDRLLAGALDAAGRLPVDGSVRAALVDLARYATARDQ